VDSIDFKPRDGIIASEKKVQKPKKGSFYVVPHEFDTSDITESDRRETIKRHYDFIKWCENNTTASYSIDNNYSPDGITVAFDSAEDCSEFMEYITNSYCIFLHN